MSVYTDLTARFTYKLLNTWGDHDALAENDKFLKDNGWQDSVVVPFFQAAAPTGWTQVVTQNNKMLRVVSGSGGGAGGTTTLSSTITRAHTHSISNQAAHTHNVDSFHTHSMDYTAVAGGSGGTGSTAYDIAGTAGSAQGQWGTPGGGSVTRWARDWGTHDGSAVSGSDGAHDHGGVTASALADLAIAYIDIVFCSKNSSSTYTDLTTTFIHNLREVYNYLAQLAGNDAYQNGRITPTSSVAVFYQAAAPAGWTKLTTQNDKALRIVSGTGGGSGGTDVLSSDLSPTHSHSALTAGGTHNHSFPSHVHVINTGSTTSGASLSSGGYLINDGAGFIYRTDGTAVSQSVLIGQTASDGSGTATTDADHQHSVNSTTLTSNFAYVDVIQCSKNSTGAPQAYADYTAFFVDQNLLAYQDLQQLAYNDAYLNYHIVPATAVMPFFQAAAPLNWTKVTTQNDKALRVVSGGTGGSAGGGSVGPSSAIVLAHTHSIASYGHTHTLSHSHTWGTSTQANAGNHPGGGGFTDLARLYGNGVFNTLNWQSTATSGGGDRKIKVTSQAATGTLVTFSHTHGGTTGSALSNVTMAYVDVILCSKN